MQNAYADLPRWNADRQGKNDRNLTAIETQNPIAPRASCEIEFQLIHPVHDQYFNSVQFVTPPKPHPACKAPRPVAIPGARSRTIRATVRPPTESSSALPRAEMLRTRDRAYLGSVGCPAADPSE